MSNQEIIQNFYEAFQRGDFQTMQDFYADDAHFHDPVFQNLTGMEAGKMWEMLLTRSKDLNISLGKITETPNGGSAFWVAKYSFGKKRRQVLNRIQAKFEIQEGKIIKHTDEFNLRKWMNQALGPTGKWLGWTPFLRKQIQTQAQKSLQKFMQKEQG
jgi:limonene-1,2-epoxide hydrolase